MCSLQVMYSSAAGGLREDVIVDAAYRRRGIGSALPDTREQSASRGLRRLQLLADRHDTAAAQGRLAGNPLTGLHRHLLS